MKLIHILSLLLLNLLIKGAIILRPLEVLDDLVIPDDAYLSLQIAKNIASGLGPLYGLDYTNGFQPLYVFLMTPIFYIFQGDIIAPVYGSLLLSTIFDSLTLYLLIRLAMRLTGTITAPLLIGLSWATGPYVISTTLNGLETMMATAFTVGTFYLLTKLLTDSGYGDNKREYTLGSIKVGILLGLGAVTRIDSLVLLPAVTLVVIYYNSPYYRPEGAQGESSFNLERIVRFLLIVSAAIFLINLPWWYFSYTYTGDIYQISGKAVRQLSLIGLGGEAPTFDWYYKHIMHAFKVIYAGSPAGYTTLLLLLAFSPLLIKGKVRGALLRSALPLSGYLLFCGALFLAYTLYIFTPWFYYRYLFPFVLIPLFFSPVLIEAIGKGLHSARLRAPLGVVAALVLIGPNVTSDRFISFYRGENTNTQGYMNLGLWAKRTFPEGMTIGSMQTGGLAYFGEGLTVINLDGVVNKRCYEYLVAGRGMEYLRELKREVNLRYIILTPENLGKFIAQSKSYRKGDLKVLTKIKEFRSWDQEWLVIEVMG